MIKTSAATPSTGVAARDMIKREETIMTRYQAIINTPGYLSEQDDLPEFDSIKEAWEYLAEERERDWGMEELPEGEESALESLRSQDLCSVVVLPTPGEPRLYDLGVAYTVTEAPPEAHDEDELQCGCSNPYCQA